MATCRRWPSPVSRRLYSAPTIVIAISMPVPVSPSETPGRAGGPFLSPVTPKVPPHAWATTAKTTARIAHFRVLDLHDVGTQPAECLGTGRTCLELGEIDDLHALQEGEVADAGGHRTSSLTISRSVRARHSASTPGLSNVTRPRASFRPFDLGCAGSIRSLEIAFQRSGRIQMSAHHTPEE